MFKINKDERGQVGIGTMIVFIAMVLVASVAAAVLIQTSGYLQQRAMSVGRQTTEEVSTGVYVFQIGGHVNDKSLNQLIIYVRPNMGGSTVDLNQTIMKLSNGGIQSVLRFNDTTSNGELEAVTDISGEGVNDIYSASAWNGTSDSQFGIVVLQDADSSVQKTGSVVINDGDKVGLLVNTTAVFGGLGTRKQVVGEVVPEVGSPGIISFNTPPAYMKKTIELQ